MQPAVPRAPLTSSSTLALELLGPVARGKPLHFSEPASFPTRRGRPKLLRTCGHCGRQQRGVAVWALPGRVVLLCRVPAGGVASEDGYARCRVPASCVRPIQSKESGCVAEPGSLEMQPGRPASTSTLLSPVNNCPGG